MGDPGLAGQRLPARIETYADHRIAMSFALAGLLIEGITILDPDCTAKTWPGYWADAVEPGGRAALGRVRDASPRARRVNRAAPSTGG